MRSWIPARLQESVLLDDVEGVSLVGTQPGSAQQCAQRSRRAPLSSDHFTHVAFRDFEFDYSTVEFLNENLVRLVDERLRDHLNQRTWISRRLGHKRCSAQKPDAMTRVPVPLRRPARTSRTAY